MKKLVLVLTFTAFSAGASMAQTTASPAPAPGATEVASPITPAERAERLTQRMTKQLTLTADQSAKINALNLQRLTEQQALRQKLQATPDRATIRKEMQALQEKYQAQYQAVLTPEQYAKFEASQAPRRDRRGPNGFPAQRPEQPRDKP